MIVSSYISGPCFWLDRCAIVLDRGLSYVVALIDGLANVKLWFNKFFWSDSEGALIPEPSILRYFLGLSHPLVFCH